MTFKMLKLKRSGNRENTFINNVYSMTCGNTDHFL